MNVLCGTSFVCGYIPRLRKGEGENHVVSDVAWSQCGGGLGGVWWGQAADAGCIPATLRLAELFSARRGGSEKLIDGLDPNPDMSLTLYQKVFLPSTLRFRAAGCAGEACLRMSAS